MDYGFFISDDFVRTYCAAIVALLLYWASKLIYKARKLHKKLRDLNDELRSIDGEAGFSSAFEDYNSSLFRNICGLEANFSFQQ